MKTLSISFVTFCVIAAASVALAQTTSFDIEVGYQEVDVEGSEDMFNTQINQDSGFVLRNLSINFVDPSAEPGFADRLRVDAAGFGGNPAGRLRLDLARGGSYRLRLFYHQFQSFSALPGHANPLIEDGIVPGQHTWDRTRDVLDVQLELPIWRAITPIVGYRWNRYEGPGQTTYSVGNDEFRLSSDLEQTESEYYVGVNFHTDTVVGTFIQGWREFEGTDRNRLAPGEGAGNDPGDTLGQEIVLDSFDRSTTTNAETPVTTFNMAVRASDQVRLIGSYVRADYEGDTSLNEDLSGNLVSFQLARFFRGLDQTISSRTENPYSRGEFRFELDLSPKIGVKAGYEARRRDLRGWALISSLYLDTVNLGGFDPRDITTLVDAENGYQRDDNILRARADFRDFGAFSAWAEFASNDQQLDVSEDISQIVLPGGQEGQFERRLHRYEVGGMLDLGAARLMLDYSGQDADQAIMRTDFTDRTRLRGRIDWSLGSFLRLLATAEAIDFDNLSEGIGYEAETRRYALDIDVTPTDNLMLGVAWDSSTTDTVIPIRIPQTLAVGQSLYAEDGEFLTGDLRWRISIVTLEAAYSTFENEGSFPLTMDRAFARAAVDITDAIGAAVEYESWDYDETTFPIGNYDADRYGIYLRWRR